MARRARVTMEPGEPGSGVLTQKALTRQEFARRLYRLMVQKGWTQSDLAREAYGEIEDPATGYKVAAGRDKVSTYIRGRSFPDRKSLEALAKALGVKPEDLLPNTMEAAIDAEIPAVELKQVSGHPGTAWLRINRALSFSTAARIIDLINQEDSAKKADK